METKPVLLLLLFFFLLLYRICSDDDEQMNWTRINNQENRSIDSLTSYCKNSTFIHTVLYRQLKLNVGKQNLSVLTNSNMVKDEEKPKSVCMYWLVSPPPQCFSRPVGVEPLSQAASLQLPGSLTFCFWFHLPDVMTILWAGQSPSLYDFLFGFFLFFMHAALDGLLLTQWGGWGGGGRLLWSLRRAPQGRGRGGGV